MSHKFYSTSTSTSTSTYILREPPEGVWRRVPWVPLSVLPSIPVSYCSWKERLPVCLCVGSNLSDFIVMVPSRDIRRREQNTAWVLGEGMLSKLQQKPVPSYWASLLQSLPLEFICHLRNAFAITKWSCNEARRSPLDLLYLLYQPYLVRIPHWWAVFNQWANKCTVTYFLCFRTAFP